jgi:hypothetical protein
MTGTADEPGLPRSQAHKSGEPLGIVSMCDAKGATKSQTNSVIPRTCTKYVIFLHLRIAKSLVFAALIFSYWIDLIFVIGWRCGGVFDNR